MDTNDRHSKFLKEHRDRILHLSRCIITSTYDFHHNPADKSRKNISQLVCDWATLTQIQNLALELELEANKVAYLIKWLSDTRWLSELSPKSNAGTIRSSLQKFKTSLHPVKNALSAITDEVRELLPNTPPKTKISIYLEFLQGLSQSEVTQHSQTPKEKHKTPSIERFETAKNETISMFESGQLVELEQLLYSKFDPMEQEQTRPDEADVVKNMNPVVFVIGIAAVIGLAALGYVLFNKLGKQKPEGAAKVPPRPDYLVFARENLRSLDMTDSLSLKSFLDDTAIFACLSAPKRDALPKPTEETQHLGQVLVVALNEEDGLQWKEELSVRGLSMFIKRDLADYIAGVPDDRKELVEVDMRSLRNMGLRTVI